MMITHTIYKQEQQNTKIDIGANRHIKSSISSNSNCGGSNNNTSNNQRQEQQQTTMKQLSTYICSEPNKCTDNNSKKKNS